MIGSVGGSEFLLIAVLALLLFGPRKLPHLGRTLGRAMAEFRGAANQFRSSLEREVEVERIREVRDEIASTGREAVGAGPSTVPENDPERDAPAEDGNA